MARKRTAITLNKLSRKSATNLESLVAELTGDAPKASNAAKSARWSKRFVASGKNFAPKLRTS